MSDVSSFVELLIHGNRLKLTPRTGWALRGVASPESAADHSYGVAFTALLLAQVINAEFDLGKLLAVALLHDFPEGTTADIPAPAWDYFPANVKESVEKHIMDDILPVDDFADPLRELWNEFQAGESPEVKLVNDADKLDRYLQALVYEIQTGNRMLGEFWEKPATFNFSQSQDVYDELRSRRLSLWR